MIFVVVAAFLSFIFWPNGSNRAAFEAFIGLSLINVLLAYRLNKINWSVALLFIIASLSSVFITVFPNIYSRPLPILYDLKISAIMMEAYIVLILFGILPFLLNIEFFRTLLGALLLAAVTDAAWMIIRTIIWGPTQCYAMLSNSAMDASFIATMFPLVLYGLNHKFFKMAIPAALIMVVAVILTKSSTGIGGLGVAIASFLLIHYGWKSLLAIAPLAVGISAGAYIYLKDELLNSNGRTSIWKMSMDFYWHETHRLFGAGLGSFYFWAPEIQIHAAGDKIPAPGMVIFQWMHNDWLQVLFELGILGAVALGAMVLMMMIKSWKKKNSLFPILCTLCFVGITQMPLRLFAFQCLGACLIMLCFDEEKKNGTTNLQN